MPGPLTFSNLRWWCFSFQQLVQIFYLHQWWLPLAASCAGSFFLRHTHTHLYLYLYYHCQNWLRGPLSGGEPAEGNKTGGPVGSGDTSLISPVAWPPQCSRGTHLSACKTHEMREVGYGLELRYQNIRSGLLAIGFPTYTWFISSRWLACVALSVPKHWEVR